MFPKLLSLKQAGQNSKPPVQQLQGWTVLLLK